MCTIKKKDGRNEGLENIVLIEISSEILSSLEILNVERIAKRLYKICNEVGNASLSVLSTASLLILTMINNDDIHSDSYDERNQTNQMNHQCLKYHVPRHSWQNTCIILID